MPLQRAIESAFPDDPLTRLAFDDLMFTLIPRQGRFQESSKMTAPLSSVVAAQIA